MDSIPIGARRRPPARGGALTTLLHIDSSPLRSGSVTRRLTAEFVAAWRELRPDTEVLRRDLSDPAPPHLSEAGLAALWDPGAAAGPEQAALLALSDRMIRELEAADLVVLGSPMYNFTVRLISTPGPTDVRGPANPG